MLSAPLILGNDPRHMNTPTLDILLAPEILALSQDALALQARKVSKPAVSQAQAYCHFNKKERVHDAQVSI